MEDNNSNETLEQTCPMDEKDDDESCYTEEQLRNHRILDAITMHYDYVIIEQTLGKIIRTKSHIIPKS